MSLDRYRRARDFRVSPEPPGDEQVRAARAASGTPRLFCVQKHLARHLHYDLRLEHEGVLLSWAVPKGPSLDPRDRRLAMRVEDHPIEYAAFEGVIPEGYGAGLVMLWDYGTWTPQVDQVGAALDRGELKFTLDGYKLKGSWVLVRTRYPPRGRQRETGRGETARASSSWLLIKHRDAWSGALDITRVAPLSVKCGGDFADILAQGDPDVWRTRRPVASGESGEMLARIIEEAARRAHARGPARQNRGRAPRAGRRTGAEATMPARETRRRR
jgi:bifunctional non-homologous end joining protein LigD